MINIAINDKRLKVKEGKTILEVSADIGIKIPTLCFHKELTPYGACRLCLVEIITGENNGLEAACVYKVTEGLVIKTDTEKVKKTRRIIFELLLARSPESEKLKALAAEYGVEKTRIKLNDETNCLNCGLCVRVCAEIAGREAINFAWRGVKRRVQTPFDRLSDFCIGCGACKYICPIDKIEIKENF
ncbi:MAG: 2Fe-2S iron-sulfur cluster-binding protein [Candidatus Omnitrophota bacterium]